MKPGFELQAPFGVSFKVEGDGESAALLNKLQGRGIPLKMYSDISRAAGDVYRKHFKDRDHTHANKLGGARSHFYWQAGESVTDQPTSEGAEIVISKTGLRQRWLGGDIYPKNAKKLAIPARSESYGVRPKEFPGDLAVIKFKSGAMALVLDDQTHTVDDVGNYKILSAEKGQKKTRKKKVGLVMYWLVDHVYQRPDPTVMPSPATVLDAVVAAATKHLLQEVANG